MGGFSHFTKHTIAAIERFGKSLELMESGHGRDKYRDGFIPYSIVSF